MNPIRKWLRARGGQSGRCGMTTRLYPKKHETNRHLDRRWRLDAELVYDHGASTWSWGYRTRLTARLAAWWHHNIASYGGSITLTDTEPR